MSDPACAPDEWRAQRAVAEMRSLLAIASDPAAGTTKLVEAMLVEASLQGVRMGILLASLLMIAGRHASQTDHPPACVDGMALFMREIAAANLARPS